MTHPIHAVEAMRDFTEVQAAALSDVVVACAGECATRLRRWHNGAGADCLVHAVRARDDAELAIVQLGLAALAHPDDSRFADHEQRACAAVAGADVAAEFCRAGDARIVPPLDDVARRGAISGQPMRWWYRAAGGVELAQ